MIKSINHYESVAQGVVSDFDLPVIPSSKTYAIKSIDFTCPASNFSAVAIFWKSVSYSNIKSATYSDRLCDFSSPIILKGNGTNTKIIIRLDNSNGISSSSAILGCTIYYEELGL